MPTHERHASPKAEMILRDRHVLVTGGSSGIGLALALQSAQAGARVSLLARDAARLSAAREKIEAASAGARVFTAQADVSRESQVRDAVAAAERALGPVDVLVTSAGIAEPGYFAEIPVEVFERTMTVNYLGTVYALKAAVPGMRQRRRGAVVLISSGAGLVGLFGYSAYAPSKFALRGLAESLRGELGPDGVHVMIVYPPDTLTPQLEQENRTKPPETRALTAGAGLWTAEQVARATLRGLRRRRFSVTPGLPLTALKWFHSLVEPFLHRSFDRTAAGARPK